MKIIYASCSCSKKKSKELFKSMNLIPGPDQKYHRLLMEGLALNDVEIVAITSLPVTNRNCSKKFIYGTEDEENGVRYSYLTIVNIPVIKNLFTMAGSFFKTVKNFKNDKEATIICDVLNKSVATGALCASKLLKRTSIGIVTDIPVLISDKGKSFSVRINNFIIDQFDSYVISRAFERSR